MVRVSNLAKPGEGKWEYRSMFIVAHGTKPERIDPRDWSMELMNSPAF